MTPTMMVSVSSCAFCAFLLLTIGEQQGISAFVTNSLQPNNSLLLKAASSKEDEPALSSIISRREVFAQASASLAAYSILQIPTSAYAADDGATSTSTPVSISASWSAISGLNKAESGDDVVSFDASAYKAMRDDPSRTPLFQKAIIERLKNQATPNLVILDLGTGPYALFAILAAQAGAGKVYAIEADPDSAEQARYSIEKAGFSDIITVIEGYSTDISLPNNEKVDVVVAEIVGSIASEEGAFATIKDCHSRFVKEPNLASSWIPCRIQTYAAPASYTLHNLFRPPEFDWTKLAGEPVRFNCRDEGLQILSDPILVEDIQFAEINGSMKKSTSFQKVLTWKVDAERIEKNQEHFFSNLQSGRMDAKEAAELAETTARTISGIAFWPRLILDDAGKTVVNSRTFPSGGHQRSHWQTVLPIMAPAPVGILRGGETVQVTANFELPDKVTKAPQYSLKGSVFVSSTTITSS
jgi:SAM-dependent methyltransferase